MQGQRQQQVARHFGVHVSTIVRLVRRLGGTGRVADRPRSGRPRVTSQRQDRAIRLAHLRNRHLTAMETAVNTVGSHNRRIHPKTVRNRLRVFGLRARRPNVGLPLNRARRARRMAWVTAQVPRRFPVRQWRRVFYTDESRCPSLSCPLDYCPPGGKPTMDRLPPGGQPVPGYPTPTLVIFSPGGQHIPAGLSCPPGVKINQPGYLAPHP